MASIRKTWRSSTTSKFPLFKKNSVENNAFVTNKPKPEFSIPTHFRCPISLDLMKDPVTLSTGITYDRESIETWLAMENSTCPVTKQTLPQIEELVPNHALRKMIQDWCVLNRNFGVVRIPTPKIPITPFQASELLSQISSTSSRGDQHQCKELVKKMKLIAKENERNRTTIMMSDASRILAASFRDLASDQQYLSVNSDLLSLLSLFTINEEACHHIASSKSLNGIVSILNSGELAGRFSAVLVLKELLASSNSDRIDMISSTEGLTEALVKLIERPISPNTTKASLVTIFYMCSSSEKTSGRFVSMNLISMLLEIIVESDKSMTEKALAVLDSILSAKSGREMAYRNALTIPVLVKKMIRISDMATEFAVSAFWKLCKGSKGEECLAEALQVGVFQKLLLLLQIGCKVATKDKVSELLKLLNGSRGNLECIETVDFKGLKRPLRYII